MPRNNLLFLISVLFCSSLGAQNFFSKKLEGRVFSKDGDVSATHVLNISTKKATITDIDGFFSIQVQLNDTLLFSAVQYKKKQIVITSEIQYQKVLQVLLEDAINELDEVTVTPYNLTGNINQDIDIIKTEAIVTAHTIGLPNAYARVPSKAERELFEATSGGGLLPLNPILNGISGRTKMLKKRLARNNLYERTERVKAFYADSLFSAKLKVPDDKIDDFLYFCEIDADFQTVVDSHDRLKIWEFIRKKSVAYLENNKTEEN